MSTSSRRGVAGGTRPPFELAPDSKSIADVRVAVGPMRWNGLRVRESYVIPGTLAPGDRVTVRLDRAPLDPDKLPAYGTAVVQAAIVD